MRRIITKNLRLLTLAILFMLAAGWPLAGIAQETGENAESSSSDATTVEEVTETATEAVNAADSTTSETSTVETTETPTSPEETVETVDDVLAPPPTTVAPTTNGITASTLDATVVTASETDVSAPLPNVQARVVVNDQAPVVVTGEQTNRTLLNTTSSVVVYSGADLETRNIDNLQQAIAQTPGVNFVGNDAGIVIRGVRALGGTTNAGQRFTSSVAIIQDGVSLYRQELAGDPLNLWDVKQVEILRGGQSINLGQSTLAGAVVVESNDPTDEFEVNFEQDIYSYGGSASYGTVNIPIAEGLAARFSGGYVSEDGFNHNPTLGQDEGATSNWFFRGKLLYDQGNGFRALSTYQYSDVRLGEVRVSNLNDPIPPTRVDPFTRTVLSNVAETSSFMTESFSQQFEIDLGDDWTAESTFSFRESLHNLRADGDGRANSLRLDGPNQNIPVLGLSNDSRTFRDELSQEFSADVRFRFDDGGKFRGQVGAYYSNEDIEESFGQLQGDQTTALVNAGLAPFDPRQPNFLGTNGAYLVDSLLSAEASFRNYAFFAEGEYDLTDELLVRAGIRYDNVVNGESATERYIASAAGPVFGPPVNIPTGVPLITLNENSLEQTNLDAFLPSASISYEFEDDTVLSFLYKKSYRTGGVELLIAPLLNPLNTFDPEFTDTFELAFRADNLGDFAVSTNLYYVDWTDQQVGVEIPGAPPQVSSRTVNAGSSEQYGIEGQVEYFPCDQLTLYTSFAFAHTEFKEFFDPTNGNNFAGNEFPYAPETMVNAGVIAQLTDDLFFNINVNYQDEVFVDPANTTTIDSRAVVNASLTYDKDIWYASLYVYNLFDEEYLTQAAATGTTVVVGDPTVIGIKGGIRF
ncbi:MAG: TonB-dependent receptor [Verrucomicrobiota bacterium]